MHDTVQAWLRQLWHEHPALFHGTRVLECGSLIVNATASGFFADCEYTGLDATPGPGVDVVSLVHEYQPEEPFDVALSTSMLEHDPHWRESVTHMADLLRPGGSLILTFPNPGWPEHELSCSPGESYYRNLEAGEVLALLDGRFDDVRAKRGDRRPETFVLALGKREVLNANLEY